MEDIDFPECSFDIVISSMALHYVENLKPLVTRISRMTAPGGLLHLFCGTPCIYGTCHAGLVL